MRQRTKLLAIFLAAFAAMAAFVSCNDDDDKVNVYVAMGTVEKTGKDYSIRYDYDYDKAFALSDSVMLVVNKCNTPGQRLITEFYQSGTSRADSNVVTLLSVYKVLTKPIFRYPTPQESDSLGNSPIELDDAWVSGGYLNLQYTVASGFYGEVPHYINLVMNTAELTGDGLLQLQLVHNDMGASRDVKRVGYASFPLPKDIKGLKGFSINYTPYTGSPSTKELKLTDSAHDNIQNDGVRAAIESK